MAICSGDGWMDEKADENKYDVYENFICMFFFFSLSSSSSYSSQLLGLNGRWWLGVWCQLHSPFNHNLCSDDSWWLTDDARFYNINGIKCLLHIHNMKIEPVNVGLSRKLSWKELWGFLHYIGICRRIILILECT